MMLASHEIYCIHAYNCLLNESMNDCCVFVFIAILLLLYLLLYIIIIIIIIIIDCTYSCTNLLNVTISQSRFIDLCI